MTLSQAQFQKYIAALRKINNKAVEEFRNFTIKNGGYAHIDRQVLIDYAYGIATKYGESAAALSAEMYDTIAQASNALVPSAIPADTAGYQEVKKTVNGIIKNTGSDDVLADGIGRLVKMAGTDTTLQNAYRDREPMRASKRAYKQRHNGAQVAWVPVGDTCPFCIMLAGAGWRKQTNWGAEQHTEHVHANCDCTYMVRFDNSFTVEGYDPKEYSKMYNEADGGTMEEKLNAMRREDYAEHKDEINEQKREAYARRQEETT